jgi:hypothetical protein
MMLRQVVLVGSISLLVLAAGQSLFDYLLFTGSLVRLFLF